MIDPFLGVSALLSGSLVGDRLSFFILLEPLAVRGTVVDVGAVLVVGVQVVSVQSLEESRKKVEDLIKIKRFTCKQR